MIFFYGLTSSKGCVCIIHISFIITLYRMCSEKNKIMMTFYLYWTIQNNNETWFDITCILKYRATYWTCTLIAIFDKIWFFSLNHLNFSSNLLLHIFILSNFQDPGLVIWVVFSWYDAIFFTSGLFFLLAAILTPRTKFGKDIYIISWFELLQIILSFHSNWCLDENFKSYDYVSKVITIKLMLFLKFIIVVQYHKIQNQHTSTMFLVT